MNNNFKFIFFSSFLLFNSFASFSSSEDLKKDNLNLCYANNSLFSPMTLENYSESSEVIADSSEISKNLYKLRGNVSLTSKDYFLTGEQVFVNRDEKSVESTSNVKFQDNSMFLVSDYLKVSKSNDKNYIHANNAKFILNESYMRGYASSLDGTESFKTFNDASYTKCPVSSNAWSINSAKITLDTYNNIGKSKDTFLNFFGIPVFYSPYFDWVLEGRGSGFLAPTLSTYEENGNNEINFIIPYYFNLSPDSDLLLTLNSHSSRGNAIEAKYRTLINNNLNENAEVEFLILNKDKILNRSRWYLNSKIKKNISNNTFFNINSKRVSDKNFFKDILHENTSVDSIDSNASISHFGKDFFLQLYTENEQLINNGNSEYTKNHEIFIQKNSNLNKDRFLKIGLTNTKFAHKDKSNIEGNRSHINITLNDWSNKDLYYYFYPSFSILSSYYSLSNGEDIARNTYEFKFDSGLNFERSISLFGKNIIQTLSPKITYKFSPKKNQSNIPIFDSEEISSISQIISSSNNFYGIDRLSNSNDINFSINSEFFDDDNGQTYLNLNLGQKFYLNNEKLNINGDFDRIGNHSNIYTSLDLDLDKFKLNQNFEINPNSYNVVKSTSSLSYILSPRKFISVNYFDESEESLGVYGAIPLNKNIHFFTGINRSISNSRYNKVTTGLSYESCCWAARVAHFNYLSDTNSYDKITNFELVFKGLSSTSPSLARKIENEIPFYIADLDSLKN